MSSANDRLIAEFLHQRNPQGVALLLTTYGIIVRDKLRAEFRGRLDFAAVDDAIQDATEKLLRPLPATFDPSRWASVPGYYLMCCRNAARTLLARRRWADQTPDDLEPPAAVDDGAEVNELYREVVDLVHQLPRLESLVMMAQIQAGGHLSTAEMMHRFGSTRHGIHVARSKALHTILQVLAARGHRFAQDWIDEVAAARANRETKEETPWTSANDRDGPSTAHTGMP